jgi:hypothetical protein
MREKILGIIRGKKKVNRKTAWLFGITSLTIRLHHSPVQFAIQQARRWGLEKVNLDRKKRTHG